MKGASAPDHKDLSSILDAFLAQMEAGRTPKAEDWLARHPELADELGPCLKAIQTMGAPEAGAAPRIEIDSQSPLAQLAP